MNRLNFLTAALLATFVLNGCGRKPATSADLLPPVSVQTRVAESKNRVAMEEDIGTVRAQLHAVIEAKVSGKIEQMLVVPGQEVTNGELLAAIDAREIQAQYDQASAVRQQAENDLKRANDLYQQKILSSSEFDAAQSKFRVADATVNEAETLLGYTKVTAPFAGIITRKDADVGDLAAPGKSLLEIEDPRQLRLEADVPEALVDKFKLGDTLPVRVGALEAKFPSVVSEIAPSADPNSRTFIVKLDLPSVPGLRAGQFGRVAVPTGEVSALRVPASAVMERGDMQLLFVVADNHAQLRIVKTGARVGDEVEIVSGLDSGETVVISGADNLSDGQPVVVKP
ncbi:MAG TPA: efflux RND transporter periplasmic adaptor subunit [Candidatus Sulfopaludibacter sp.]|nr:efflux RND transporter periplasmic adaptor subunit [Candidatus Sulfopaludibacter sp.]